MIHATQDQYSPDWWAARRGVPTASKAGSLLTPAKWKPGTSQGTYIAELIGGLYDPAYGRTDDYQSAAMKNGHVFEPEARAFYEFETGQQVEEVGLILSDDGRFGCSPDGMCDDRGVEIKSPTHPIHVQYLIEGHVPVKYLPQIHFSMVVTGLDQWDFLSYARGLPSLLLSVKRDDKTEAMAKEMEAFHKKYVAARQLIEDMNPNKAFGDHQEEVAVAKMF